MPANGRRDLIRRLKVNLTLLLGWQTCISYVAVPDALTSMCYTLLVLSWFSTAIHVILVFDNACKYIHLIKLNFCSPFCYEIFAL